VRRRGYGQRITGIRTRRPSTHGGPGRDAERRAIRALQRDAGERAGVLLLGMEDVGDRPWDVLTGAGLGLVRVADVPDAVRALTERAAQVVIADADNGPALTRVVRARPDLAGAHIVVCAALESPHELRAALDAGADDVMRIPFEPELTVPIPRMGRSSNCASVTLCTMSPLSVFSSVASALTVTDSDADPTSSARSSGSTWPAAT